MLQSDEIILKILLKAQNDGNQLLNHFKIGYPSKLIYENNDLFDNKPIIRNITPEYNRDFVLTRGHLRIQVKSEPESLVPSEGDYYLCNLLLEKIEEK